MYYEFIPDGYDMYEIVVDDYEQAIEYLKAIFNAYNIVDFMLYDKGCESVEVEWIYADSRQHNDSIRFNFFDEDEVYYFKSYCNDWYKEVFSYDAI